MYWLLGVCFGVWINFNFILLIDILVELLSRVRFFEGMLFDFIIVVVLFLFMYMGSLFLIVSFLMLGILILSWLNGGGGDLFVWLKW